MKFTTLDFAVLFVFYAVILGVSWWKSRREDTSADYFLGGRSLPWWLIGISIVAANISTEQMVGMAGNAAGGVGLAVSAWQLVGSVGIVLIAFTLLPIFLRAGIYTIPEYLEYRYNAAARSIMAISMVIVYSVVLLAAVFYSGALVLQTIFGLDLVTAVWVLGAVAALFATWGGLKAVAWADLFMGIALILGGILVFVLGLRACGGWQNFSTVNAGRLHMMLPASHPDLPWTGVLSGMWIVILYYCGLNQFIVQRNLAARSLKDSQLGMVFAAALWLLVPFVIVMPGLMAAQIYGDKLAKPDEAFPTLVSNLVPEGVRGFMLAAIAAAIISSLASMANSAATIFTMDVYHRLFDPRASQKRLVALGRVVTLATLVVGCLVAPLLDDPKGIFQYIQQFQGYIWPGVCAAFVVGMLVPRAPAEAGVAALLCGPALYYLFQKYAPGLNFLLQVALTFQLVIFIMGLITFWKPLAEPRTLPVRAKVETTTDRFTAWCGVAVITGVAAFWIYFW